MKSAYTLMPFTSRVLPWTLQSELLRFRRVGDWLGLSLHDDVAGTTGLSGNQCAVRTINEYDDITSLMLDDG